MAYTVLTLSGDIYTIEADNAEVRANGNLVLTRGDVITAYFHVRHWHSWGKAPSA